MTAVKVIMGKDSSEKVSKTEKKKKRRKETIEDVHAEDGDEPKEIKPEKKKKHKKEKKKEKKKKETAKHCEQREKDDQEPVARQQEEADDRNKDKELRKRKRQKKVEEKEALLAKLPKVNEDGVAYTKSQIRRMMKRVKHGLTPLPSKKEAQEQSRLEALDRKQEETLYFGDGEADANDDVENDEEKEEENPEEGKGGTAKGNGLSEEEEEEEVTRTEHSSNKKKARRKKAVPDDYICSACRNKHEPRHWIYDCPDKVTVKGTNAVAKKLRGLHEPDANKLFLSGLPFEYKPKDLEALITSQNCGKLVHAKLVTFPDTGRCKGQAYITFESEAAAREALKKLNGQTVVFNGEGDKKKTKGAIEKPKKELRLKVSKVLSRFVTKNKSK